MKGFDDGPIIRGGKNTVRQIRSNMMEKPRLNFFCLVSDTRGGGYHKGLLGWRALARYWKLIKEIDL